MTKSTGVGRGGLRDPKGGRPKGSKTKTYRPHVAKVLAAVALTPLAVLTDVMMQHYRAKRFDDAARVAALAAPYVHARLSATSLEVKPSVAQMIVEMSDEELTEHVRELRELAGLSDKDRALVRAKPKGSA
jgi:hypothetical protein